MNIFLRLALAVLITSLYTGSRNLAAQSGALDPTFANNGLAITDVGIYQRNKVVQMILHDDGRITALSPTWNSTDYDFALVRYLSDGTPDPDFGVNGQVTTNIGSYDQPTSMALLPDGKILVAGQSSYSVLVRYMPDGAPDLAFGTNGVITLPGNRQVASVAMLPNGKILLGGSYFDQETSWDMAVTRLLPNGELDPGFGTEGTVRVDLQQRYDIGSTLDVLPNGRILLAGYTNWNDGNISWQDLVVVRLLDDGSFDPSFGTSGKVTYDLVASSNSLDQPNDLEPLPDGGMLLACLVVVNGDWDLGVVKLQANGQLDTGFATGGTSVVDHNNQSQNPYAIKVLADGKLIVGGYYYHKFGLWRFLANGTLDPGFGDAGVVRVGVDPSSLEYAYSMAVQPDGKILLGGSTTYQCLLNTILVARFQNDLSMDVSSPVEGITTMQAWPNPASDVITLDMMAGQSGDATVTMFDATGRVVLGAQRLGLAKGEQRYMTINASALNNGTYFLLIEQNGTTTTQRVMVAH